MAHLSDFKAVLFDIDRTLIPPSREIYPEIPTLLQKLHEQGILVGLCSGRGFSSVKNSLVPLFPKDSLHVLAGGSLVVSNTAQIIWEQTIDPQSTQELKVLIQDTKTPAIFMKPDAHYAQGEVLTNIQNHPWKQVGKDLKTMDTSGVGLIYIAHPNEDIKNYVKNNQKLSYKSMISNQGHPYYDVTAKGVTKAVALEHWSKTTKIPLSQVIGFGDSENDLEFLTACGFAVAMGNADEIIKDLADRVIGKVTDKSLPKYVQNILEGAAL